MALARSKDTIHRSCVLHPDDAPPEVLNNLQPRDLPPHRLFLKEGMPVVLLCTICAEEVMIESGTRAVVRNMQESVLELEDFKDNDCGRCFFVPRVCMKTLDPTMQFEFKRLQFPIRAAFAMTVRQSF